MSRQKGGSEMLDRFIDYTEKSLSSVKYDDILYSFERKVVEEARETERRVRKAGLDDERIIFDLLVSEHTDLPDAYAEYRKAELRRRREHSIHKFIMKFTPVYFIVAVAVYLFIGFYTRAWNKSWLAIIFAVTLWYDSVGGYFIDNFAEKRRVFHPAARVILALGVMLTAVCVYLHVLMLAPFFNCWVIVPAGVFVMFWADGIFATVTKQPVRIINFLIYIIASSPMVYVVLSGLRILDWRTGWLVIIFALVLDFAVIVGALINRRKYVWHPEKEAAK